jgi:serine phosphatase RsbU (regulator of sigma subunit)
MPAVEATTGVATGMVLVIDDDPVVSRVAAALLRRHGYCVECCPDAAGGIERAREHPPDVILLDIDMPGLGGMDACRILRQSPGLARVPVMFFSAGAKEQFIEQGFRAGASDYLEKPFTEAELLARVANLTRMARYEQSLRDTMAELRSKSELLSNELEAARSAQWAMLPVSLTPHPSLRSAVLYEPVVGVGGDLYDLELAADGSIRLMVADVSGHGVFAALLAAFFKMGYQVYSQREGGPAAVLQSIHREMCRSFDTGLFVTALVAWLDPETGRLRYASAGHAPGLWRRTAIPQMERLLPTGPVVGLIEESRFEEKEIRLEQTDGLILLTDGILEALNPSDQPYGLHRVELLTTSKPRAIPAELLQNLRIDLDAFQGTVLPDDDLTALVVEWYPRAA